MKLSPQSLPPVGTEDIRIVGIGETQPTRVSEKPVDELVMEAIHAALEDAGLSSADVDGVISDQVYGPRSITQQEVAARLGRQHIWTAGRSIGGAAMMSAPALAAQAICSGQASVVVFYFGIDNGSRMGGPYANHNRYSAKTHFEMPYGFTGQPVYFSLWARRYLSVFPDASGALAGLAVSASHNGYLTGRAQRPTPLLEADYWKGPMIADPLRLRDCCVISDGAGAYVMTSVARARDCRKRAVRVLASTLATPSVSPTDVFTQYGDMLSLPGAREAAREAYAIAGLVAQDVSFAEIYDCFTISCLIQLEDLGFCEKGAASSFVRDRHTTLQGKLPVNTHGGFLAYSYLLGIEHIIEAVRQLRGEAGATQLASPSIGLVSGLSMPDYGVMLLAVD